MKEIKYSRKTKDADIEIHLNISPKGKSSIKTPYAFLNRLLENFSGQSNFILSIKSQAEPKANQVQFAKELGVSLGKTIKTLNKDNKGMNRVGFFAFPFEDSLGIVALDLSGKPHSAFKAKFKRGKISDLKSDSIKEFFNGFSQGADCNLAAFIPYGEKDQSKAEALFKALGKALSMACSSNINLIKDIPSLKGLTNKL